MMERIPEPELMNEEEQAKAYAFADFSAAHNSFVDLFREKFPDIHPAFNDVVLDLGCGPCDVTRRFAIAYPDAGFHAVDGAFEMLKHAQHLNQRQGFIPRIKLIEGSIPGVTFPQQQYHAIISNSLLHHLSDPVVLWQTIQQYAKPFAHIFIMDLVRPVDEQTVKFLANEYAANEPDILKSDFENSLRAAFTVDEVRQQLNETDLTNLNVEQVSDRHMIIYGII
ncbi:MAG: class I SAM-dependent methyltransferase [Gammaproteobacteria bacterium]|nr:class I SAM-dependent methyltransferase [Gammaproteobacteria bacterium]